MNGLMEMPILIEKKEVLLTFSCQEDRYWLMFSLVCIHFHLPLLLILAVAVTDMELSLFAVDNGT